MSARIRVTYLIDKLQRAGAQVHLRQLATGLDRERFAPEVVCLLDGGPVAAALEGDGVPVEVMGLGRLYGPRGLAGVPRLARRLRGRADVLHTYLVSANVYGGFAARLARVPVLVTTRRDTGFSRNWRLRLLEEWLVNPRADAVVAVSHAVAARAVQERGLSAARVVTIANGVDVAALRGWDAARADARREWGLRDEHAAIGVVAHFSPVKGHAEFLRAATLVAGENRRARFVLVGDGPLRPAMEALARRLGLADRVVFTGAREDVPRLLAMLDLVAVPSHTEGMSNALLEAMAMARPVVATAVGGNVDVLRHGVTGLLVEPRDPPALAAALVLLLDDPARAQAMGAAARAWVAEHLAPGAMVRRHEELYRSLISA
ncbi:MAG TPA: glycosyltransferase [Vicinamibacteria bacterium]